MKLEQSFEVRAPVERVWSALIDVERVAPCLPGAAVTARNDDGTYAGTFSVKIGPTSAAYSGKLEMREIDERQHRATMHAHGADKRGQGSAEATIVSTLTPAGTGTSVNVVTDYRITGRLARFGRGGMIEDISEKLLRRFADALQASLEQGEPPPPSASSAAPQPGGPGAVSGSAGAAAPAASAASGPAGSAQELNALSLLGSVALSRLKANAATIAAGIALLALIARARRRRRS